MANLTYTAYVTRQAIKYGAIGIVCLLLLRFAWEAVSAYLRVKYPPPPPQPTVLFGRLPTLSFPKQDNLPSLKFKLETIDGNFPKLPTVGKVYVVSQPTANLLALDRAKQLAYRMGFKAQPIKVTDRIYRFIGQNTATTLEIDIITQKFKLSYDFANDPSIFSEKKLPNDEQAAYEARTFLSQADLLDLSLEEGKNKVSYFKYEAPNLVPALSLSEADFVRVDLFPKDIDTLKILPPNPNESLVSLIFSGVRETNKRIVQVNYFPLLVSQENFATYPLKNTNIAWEELGSEKSFIASLGDNEDGQITIRRIYLAYYEADTQQNFLQPIFVFEGDRNFVAYVQAVDSKWNE